ncbi:hypothetical protein HHI36_015089 [Cryptolaemus montrouzieri]|uniref:Uncharacterized protein n=1 Tax=Cryptolaemus montrouzieri TaxID=559131 RepID=A0ABD2N504_9CUCU
MYEIRYIVAIGFRIIHHLTPKKWRRQLTKTELDWYAQHILDNDQDSNNGLYYDRSDSDDEKDLVPSNQDIQNAVNQFKDGVLVGDEQAQIDDQYHFSEDEADIQDPGEGNNRKIILHRRTAQKTIERFDRKKKERVQIDCLSIITRYNKQIDGVDSLIERYNIKIRSRKRRVAEQRGDTNCLKLAKFRAEIAYCLYKIGIENHRKRSRSSDVEKKIQAKKQLPLQMPMFLQRM